MPEHSTAAKKKTFIQKTIQFPLTRFIIALLFLWVAFILRDIIANGLLSLQEGSTKAVITILLVHLGYVLYVRLIERRLVYELAMPKAPKELGIGAGAGITGIVLIVSILWLFGFYGVNGFNSWALLLSAFIPVLATAYTEEIMIRGVLFRIVEEGTGTWIALIISALLFGLMHFGNDNSTVISVLSISATAGLLLAGVYILTRRLWLAIGIHFAVNWTQGAIFGLPVSGNEKEGLLQGGLEGNELLTGGLFGLEASFIMLLLGSLCAFFVLKNAYQQGCFLAPLWSKKREDSIRKDHLEQAN